MTNMTEYKGQLETTDFDIEVLNTVFSRMTMNTWKKIMSLFSFEDLIVHKRGKKIIKNQVVRHFYAKKENGFVFIYTGHLKRIVESFPNLIIKHNKATYYRLNESQIVYGNPELFGIEPRKWQLDGLEAVSSYGRGVIVAPTGTGKSGLVSCIVSRYRNYNILICANTIDLVDQMTQNIANYCRIEPKIMDGNRKPDWQEFEDTSGNVLITTIQSFKKQILIDYSFLFDVVIIDECHRVNEINSLYGEALSQMIAPIRVGVTATLPTATKEMLCLEGLIGPVIYELTKDEAETRQMIVRPRLKLHKLPYNQKINDFRTFREVVDFGISRNFNLNLKITEIIKEAVKRDQNILVFVHLLQHGDYIKALCERDNIVVDYIHGGVVGDDRNRIKQKIENQTGCAVIATTVWKEGINIPSLQHIVLGGGWKSQNPVLQAIGRGLRTHNNKEFVTIHDFFDPSHHYLISHFGERLSLYFEMEWI
jgi:superfamily II DNA or RNA helicase